MSAVQLLEDLARQGVHVWAEGEGLRYRAPSGSLTPEIRSRLTQSKAEILAFLKRRSPGVPSLGLPKVVPAPEARHEPFPLTDIQQAYWLGRTGELELGNISAHAYIEHELRDVDLPRLGQAWHRLIDSHEMLRAVILPDGRQRILEHVPPYRIEIEDLRGESPERAEATLRAARERMAHEGPPIERWPLFELRGALLDGERVRLQLSISLMICDAWSFLVIFRDLVRLYLHPGAILPPLELSYRDYVLALERLRETEAYERSLAWWRQRLPTLPAAPELPLARHPSTLSRPRFVRYSAELDPETWRGFQRRAARLNVTATSALCAAYSEVLAAWSKSPEFVLNVLFFRRLPLHPEVHEVVGNFSSTILLAVDCSSREPFAARVQAVQERLWQDIEHSHISGVQILRELSRLEGASRPSMPVVFASALNLGSQEGTEAAAPDSGRERAVHSSLQTPHVWLDHQVAERFGALVLNWDVVEDLFPPGLIPAMFGAYCDLLARLADKDAAWEEPVRRLTPAGQLAARDAVNATAAPLPPGLLHDGFFAQASRNPGRTAVISRRRSLTYGELRDGAERIAERLRGLGARPNRLVAVVMEKGWEQVLAVLGALRSGAAYLPLDASLPAERLRYLLDRGQVEVALTQPWLKDRLDWPDFVTPLVAGEESLHGDPAAPAEPAQRPEDLAYVIFTSGSTGLPKGVAIDHRGALNTVVDVNQRFQVGPEDRVLALSALNFDLSVYDVFGLLAAGGAVVMPAAEDLREPAQCLELISQERVTVWDSVPALMEMLVDHASGRGEPLPESLRLVMLSGDWVPVTLPGRIRSLSGKVQVMSLGGATEASIWSICRPIGEVDPAWPSIPYGRPMVNQTFHVLSSALEPRPVWVPGELYIGGAGLARGYWRDPEKTDASFFVHPETGERLYRTGDWGRYLSDGDIEFLGREDSQVKVQGFRIELGEIESNLLQHPQVRAAAAVALGERAGSKRLAAYVVAEPGQPLEMEELAAFLRRKVPEYMVPSRIVALDSLPLTANGKVNRSALRQAEPAGEESRGFVAPRDEMEEELAAIWREVLQSEPVGVTDSFFSLGGHSLLAVRLMARIEQRFGRRLPLSALFEAPSIERLSAVLRPQSETLERSALVPIQPRGTRPAFFCVHPVGGNVFCYLELARCLGDGQPFFGLQVPQAGDAPDGIRLEQIAAGYVRAVRERQPHGPYQLGGWSMGGVVAFEMACQLRAQGEEVAALALIDSERPRNELAETVDDATLVSWFARDLGGLVGRELPIGVEDLRELGAGEQIQLLVEEIRAAGLIQDVHPDQIRQFLAVFKRSFRAMLRYEPPVYPGSLSLLRVAGGDPAYAGDEGLGWSGRAAGGVDVETVPGDHYTMMQPPHVEVLAERLRSRLVGAGTGSLLPQ